MRRRHIAAIVVSASCLSLASWAARREHADEPPPPRANVTRADIVLPRDTELIRGLVPRNTTLETLLRMHGLASDSAHRAIDAIRGAFDPRRLRASQPFALERTLEGDLRRFEYEIDDDSSLRVTPAGPSTSLGTGPSIPLGKRPSAGEQELVAAIAPIPRQRHEVVAGGAISEATPSLFQAMESTGERPELSIALADIFSGEIDFNTELQTGDRFGLAFEKFTRESPSLDGGEARPPTYGAIAAAEFHNDGRVLRAIRFTAPGGKSGYYDEQGRSLRRFFLRSPLKFEPRITSRFSRRRLHPVLHTYRAHLGVDYGAPTGAPVVAVSAGTVVSASFDRANGRMVRLKHSGGYETYYLHLSAFAAGIRAGARVSQGQLIGKVGSTGLASGPHLDYRLRKNGVFVNPLAEHRKMPPGEPIPPSAMAAFKETRARALAQLDEAMKKAAAPAVVATTVP
jgi:murein DD-endopeptidase MepM/ murein hydrolase activator NlpD